MRFLLLGTLVAISLTACGSSTTSEDPGAGDSAVDSSTKVDSGSTSDSAAVDSSADSSAADSAKPEDSGADSSPSDTGVADTNTTSEAGAFCGGIAGIKCPTGFFCQYPSGMCTVADVGGSCAAIPTTCTKELMPVCGCDGKTYSNACEAARAGMSISKTGECGTLGKTCGGKIGVTCAKTEWCDFPSSGVACGAADGTGTCAARPDLCPGIYAPVCGCDGVTYGNACEAHMAGVDDQASGTCGK